MSDQRIIYMTDIMRRYQALREMPQAERLKEAQRMVEQPAELASEFARSVAHFTQYSNEEEFYPPTGPKRDFADTVVRTNDLVLRLEEQKRVIPIDAPNRLAASNAGPEVAAVAAARLGFDYVDRELLVQRTTSPAEWEGGEPNRGGLRLDVLLADIEDRTPIVAELKLPGDMDPFFALLQALACAAHLATPNQYARMRKHLGLGKFPELIAAPRIDVWVLFVDAADYKPGEPPKGRYMADLTSAAEALAPLLLAQDDISRSVRRIAALGMKLESGVVTSEVRWAWERTTKR